MEDKKKYIPTQYAEVAIRATEIGGNPREAWQKAAKAIMPTKSSQKKVVLELLFWGYVKKVWLKE